MTSLPDLSTVDQRDPLEFTVYLSEKPGLRCILSLCSQDTKASAAPVGVSSAASKASRHPEATCVAGYKLSEACELVILQASERRTCVRLEAWKHEPQKAYCHFGSELDKGKQTSCR